MNQLLDAVETHKKALTTQLAMAEQQYENSKESKERTEKMSLQERKQNVRYIEAKKEYELSDLECSDLAANIINLPSWNTQSNSLGQIRQSWRPGEERSKVFSGNKVLITRELLISPPVDDESLNNSIGTLNYIVEWGVENKHWLSIDLSAEAHSWCKQLI